MRIPVVYLAFVGVREVLGAPQRAFSEFDVVDYFRENPYALPDHARAIFQEKDKLVYEKLHKRQSSTTVALLGALENTVSSMGKKIPAATVFNIQDSPSPRFPEARRKKIRYGPYRIPPISEQNIESRMLNAQGMTNTLKIGAHKPCGRECMILAISADLEYADGKKVPTTPDGAWLHHCVLLNVGLNVRDATCGGIAEHVFESGNERSDSPYYSPPSGVKSGYHVRTDDIFVINTELMNMEDKEKWAWVAMEFDYIEGFQPEWKEGKIVWMSIGPNRCTGSDLNPFGVTNLTRTQQPLREKFIEYSVPWISPSDGLLLGGNSHMHDGGVSTKFYIGEKMICDSLPRYAKGNGDHAHGNGMGGMTKRQMGTHINSNIDHIEEQPACVFDKPIPIKKGEEIFIRSDYDFTMHEGMKNKKGELDEVMAIAGTLVAFEYPMK